MIFSVPHQIVGIALKFVLICFVAFGLIQSTVLAKGTFEEENKECVLLKDENGEILNQKEYEQCLKNLEVVPHRGEIIPPID